MQKGLSRSPVMVLVLSLITCGIYYLYWIYMTSLETQRYLGTNNSTSPGLEVVLCIFTCGIYYIYWNYKYGKVIAECHQRAGITVEDNSILYLLLSIFQFGLVGSIIMQSSLNRVWES